MFRKLHLFDIDRPQRNGDGGLREALYLRMAGSIPKGPAEFAWNERQLDDLEALWLDPDADGPRERLATDLARFAESLGWTIDINVLDEAEKHGDEYLLTISSAAAER